MDLFFTIATVLEFIKQRLAWGRMVNFITHLAQGGRDLALPLRRTANSRVSVKREFS